MTDLLAFAATHEAIPGVPPSQEMVSGLMMAGADEADAEIVASGLETAGARTLTRDQDLLKALPGGTEEF